VLTQTLNWRYGMYVNLAFAGIAIAGALTLLHNQAPAVRPRLDIPGVLSVSAGLFSVVYGFSHAQTTSWGTHTTLGFLVGGALLLAAFAAGVLGCVTARRAVPSVGGNANPIEGVDDESVRRRIDRSDWTAAGASSGRRGS
jgi:hypothetical protein